MHRGLTLALVVLIGGGFALGAGVVLVVGSFVAAGAGAYAEDAPPAPPQPGSAPTSELPRQKIDLGGGISFEMIRIPAGEFEMGSPESEEGRDDDERRHRVCISRPFWLARTETTQATWAAVMESKPTAGWDPTLPVTLVSWEDAQAFCKRLNEEVPGGGFRLPTEAEWEYACRAGSATRFSFGDDARALAEYAWYEQNAAGSSLSMPGHPVGLLKPNAWGLYDLHGNLWEWCADGYGGYGGVAPGVVVDPQGREGSPYRVSRGGGWGSPASNARCAARDHVKPEARDTDLGFRLARTVVADARPPQAPGRGQPSQPPAPDPMPRGEPGPAAPPSPQPAKPPLEPAPPGGMAEKVREVPAWATVAPEQLEAARKAGVPVAFENPIGMRFVLIPGGRFTMGSPPSEQDRDDTETQHEVTLSKPYYLATTEVTNAQFRRFHPEHHSQEQEKGHSLDGDDQPAGQVSWNDAVAFMGWLNRQQPDRGYRLPTEAEWERACRAGTSTPFWWGRSITTDQANYDGTTPYGGGSPGTLRRVTVPVGTLPVSPWGLYEVHGNVREWVSDVYDDQDYPKEPAVDPTGPVADPERETSHTVRGGAYGESAHMLRAAFRIGLQGDDEVRSYIGFRVAATVEGRPR